MDQPPPIVETPPPVAPPEPAMSLPARLLNVFAIPGDVFAEVKTARASVANWLVPALVTALVGIVATVILFSQPDILQKVREQQEQALEKNVKAGKMTRAQADQAMAVVEKVSSPAMMKILGGFGATFYGFARVFLWATALWLLGLWVLKLPFPYGKALEVAGLASMIGVLGVIVTLLLQVNLSNQTASPSLALAVHDFDPKKTSHLALAAMNVFDLWQVGVMACGLARLAAVPFMRAAFVLVAFWMVFQFVWITLIAGLGHLSP
jgi:hypothetical protein